MVTTDYQPNIKVNKTKTGYTVRCRDCGYYAHLTTKQFPLTRVVAEINALQHLNVCTGQVPS